MVYKILNILLALAFRDVSLCSAVASEQKWDICFIPFVNMTHIGYSG